MEIKKIAVLYGGTSSEREVSLESGRNIYSAVQALGYEASLIDYPSEFSIENSRQNDFIFIALHGYDGESGDLQELLTHESIKFSGSKSFACRRTWNKRVCKEILEINKIPTPSWFSVKALPGTFNEIFSEKLDKFRSDTDIFIKPEEDGSSVDVFKISNEQEFTEAIENCSNRNRPFIIEECIDYKEITVPILNGKCLPPIEIITKESFYNYAAKYVNDDTKLIEAKFSSNSFSMLESICIDTYTLMGCEGWARIDLLQRADKSFYVIEVNTAPGMTTHSLFPKSAAIIGLDYNSLVEEIINAK